MFVNQSPFYFATVRKISVAFGSLFNNIYIQRFDEPGGKGDVIRSIRVPLSYAAGEKWYIHRKKDIPAQESVQTKISLPRIGYRLVDMRFDQSRKLNTMGDTTAPKTGDITQFLKQLNPVPYDLAFEVDIAIKNIDDGLQIIEQILPNFAPSYTLTVKDIPELAIVKDVPIILSGLNLTDTFEGSFEEPRILVWTLSFVVKAYIYPAIKDSDIIRKVIANIYKDSELTTKSEVITVRVDPIDAEYDDDWKAETNIYQEEELDSNQEPNEDYVLNSTDLVVNGINEDVVIV